MCVATFQAGETAIFVFDEFLLLDENVVQSEIFKLESGLLLSLALQTRTQIFLSEYERIGHVDRGSCLGLCYT